MALELALDLGNGLAAPSAYWRLAAIHYPRAGGSKAEYEIYTDADARERALAPVHRRSFSFAEKLATLEAAYSATKGLSEMEGATDAQPRA